MKTKTETRGRPIGSTNEGLARKDVVTTRSISMTPSQFKKIDKLRGKLSRGKFIAQELDL
tara:strand:- start:5124 stop:5303 length:180 start_codon:yes stop_codon:yes gene_type:complete